MAAFASSFVAGTTVLVVSPVFLFLFIKSVKVDVPCFSNRSFAVVPIDSSD
jgi:hypothetical protein